LPLKASQLQTEISHPIEEVSSPEKGLANPSDLRLGPWMKSRVGYCLRTHLAGFNPFHTLLTPLIPKQQIVSPTKLLMIIKCQKPKAKPKSKSQEPSPKSNVRPRMLYAPWVQIGWAGPAPSSHPSPGTNAAATPTTWTTRTTENHKRPKKFTTHNKWREKKTTQSVNGNVQIGYDLMFAMLRQ